MTLSSYQQEIVDYFNTHKESNMYIDAKAGCGKSFIATQLLQTVQQPSIYLAFNKAIAQEMSEKIENKKVKVRTIHSLCYSIMRSNYEESVHSNNQGFGSCKKQLPDLDNFKIFKIIDDLKLTKDYAYNMFLKENYVKLYNLARLQLLDFADDLNTPDIVYQLVKDHGLFFSDEPTFVKPNRRAIYNTLVDIEAASTNAFETSGDHDFTDILYITFTKIKSKEWQVPFWNYYYNIVIDEAQDLSLIQLQLLKFIKRKTGRYIFILDPRQAIYAFCGANSHSYAYILKNFQPIEQFELPINYRCPVSHLTYVNKQYNIGIKPRNDAPEGKIIRISKQKCLEEAAPGDYIVGRKNKWLVPITLDLISRGKPVYIKNAELVQGVLSLINKSKQKSVTELSQSIRQKKINLQIKMGALQASNEINPTWASDTIEYYDIILNLIHAFKSQHSTDSKNEFIKFVENILNTTKSSNAIVVTSIHCVKGLEAKRVFVLNQGEPTINEGVMTKEQKQQEYNLSYVSLTRAQDIMFLVKPDGEEYE